MPSLKILLLALLGCIGNAQAELQFLCPTQLAQLQPEVTAYLRALRIPAEHVQATLNPVSGRLTLALSTPADDSRTLDFASRPEFALAPEAVFLPSGRREEREVSTVSRKEIMLALLQHGRVTTLSGADCRIETLVDLVGLRQNIVAWAENLNWVWPDGDYAQWNPRYWTQGTPNQGVPLRQAIMDAFLQQEKYSIGCYTAIKLLLVQGVLDYYHRVRADPVRARRVEAALLTDGEPLVDVEPGQMWHFEKDYRPADGARLGKLMLLEPGVASGHFVPGDWAYFLNTDPITYEKTGYEGSNAIYLGGNRFDDFYNDHDHSYTYEEKLNEVYQWRHEVFSRSRDADKVRPLTPEQLSGLSRTPANGGLQLDYRVSPRLF
jgi:hypothetical protein